MLILVLCAAAVLPTALSERPEAQNVQAHAMRSNEVGRRFPAGYATARNQGLLRFQKYEGGVPEISEDALPFLSDIYLALWSKNPFPLASASNPDPDSDSLEKGVLLSRSLDQIGGGHLLRRDILDAIGGGHLLKRGNGFRALDPIGGGHLLKRGFEPRQLDAIGGGHLLRRSLSDGPTENSEGKLGFERTARNGRDFDTLLGRSFGTSKRDTRGANSVYKRNFDEIDNAGFKDYLYKRNFDEIDSAGFKDDLYKRNFDEIDNAGFQDYLYKRNFDEIDNAGFKDYLFKRNFDEIDNAGFRDYLYKRNLLESFHPEPRNDKVICTPEGCLYKKPTPGYGLKY